MSPNDEPNAEVSAKEAFFDAEIAPTIAALIKRCQANGLSFVSIAEWEPGETAASAILTKDKGFKMALAYMAVQCQGNVDTLIMGLMKHAREHGHSSIFLKQLGVEPVPPGKDPSEVSTGANLAFAMTVTK